jgi:hypothetical protein
MADTQQKPLGREILLVAIDKGLFALLLAASVFLFDRSLKRFEHDQAVAETKRQAQVTLIERQLSEFYEPILMRLNIDTAIEPWRQKKWSKDTTEEAIGRSVEEKLTVPNHVAIMDILQTKMGLAAADEKLCKAIEKYYTHVALYRAQRDLNLREDPAGRGYPWPKEFPDAVRARTERLRAEYQRLTQSH